MVLFLEPFYLSTRLFLKLHYNWANNEIWTRDLFLTKETLYLWATPANVVERETGLEPATLSLEGWRSTNWATLANSLTSWGEQDSNLWRLSQQIYSLPSLTAWVSPPIKKEPIEGLEPTTCWLQISCSSQLSYIGLYWSNKIQERSPLTTLEGCKFIKVFRIGTKK